MNKGTTIAVIAGIGALAVGAVFLLRKPPAKSDPISNILSAAPDAINKTGAVVTAAQNTTSNVIKSTINLATTPARTVLSTGKDLVKSLKFW